MAVSRSCKAHRFCSVLLLSLVLAMECGIIFMIVAHSRPSHLLTNVFAYFSYGRPQQLSSESFSEAMMYLVTLGKTREKQTLYLRDVKPMKPLPNDIDNSTTYWRFVYQISNLGLYQDTPATLIGAESSLVDELVHELGHAPIVHLRSEDRTGTEFKFTATFKDGSTAIMKPMRYTRDQQVPADKFYFSEQERHHSEIAAFHLDRILGFNSVPPCAGRSLNITTDIAELADDQLKKTIFQAPNGNWCFHGTCMYFCDIHHPFCGAPDAIEFSVCMMVPFAHWGARPVVSPWRRSYSSLSSAEWQKPENNETYCLNLLSNSTNYKTGDRIFQVVDLNIFDFLMGNQDRHHYEVFRDFNYSFVTFDNGRGFGRYSTDDMWIIASLFQCCKIRKSTYEKLLYFSTHVSLSSLMRHSLARDILSTPTPLISENHLKSLDRRVKILLSLVETCVNSVGNLEKMFHL